MIGLISLLVLVAAVLGRYAFHLEGAWRRIYVVGAVIALYLNVFVLVAQSFMKVPALHAMAPTQSEPPFLIAQVLVMAIFIVPGVLAWNRFSSTRAVGRLGSLAGLPRTSST